jgi:hypothetical protein
MHRARKFGLGACPAHYNIRDKKFCDFVLIEKYIIAAMTAVIPLEKRRRNLLPKEVSENKEDIQLIWLDENLDDSSEYRRIQSTLLELNPAVQLYSDFNLCIGLIESIKNERIFLIVSCTFAHSILSKVSTHRALVAIFIFCANEQDHETSIKKYQKVIGIFTDQDCLLASVRETMDIVEKQTLAFKLFDQKQKLGRDLSKESASFIWQQMLIYILRPSSGLQRAAFCTNY